MALRRYKSLSNWDVIDDFFDEKVEGLNVQLYGFNRSFCRCGASFGDLKDRCDKCGNYDFKELNFVDYTLKNELCKVYKDNTNPLKLSVKVNELQHEEDKLNNLVIVANIREAIILEKNSIERNNSFPWFLQTKINDISNEFFKNEYKYWNLYEKYLKILSDKDNPDPDNYKNFNNLVLVFDMLKNYPNFMKDEKIFQYPNLTALVLKNGRGLNNQSLLDNLNRFKFNLNYLSSLDYSCSIKEDNYYNYRGFNEVVNEYNVLINSLNKESLNGISNLISHNLSTNFLTFSEAQQIFNKIYVAMKPKEDMDGVFNETWSYYVPKRVSWYNKDEINKHISFRDFILIEHFDYFPLYFRENIATKKSNIVEGFIEQIHDMIEYKIPIMEDNFKLKNFNYLMNAKTLYLKYKIPEDKASLFLDVFENSPLDALDLIKNRRKMTKKEIEAFYEYMMNL